MTKMNLSNEIETFLRIFVKTSYLVINGNRFRKSMIELI